MSKQNVGRYRRRYTAEGIFWAVFCGGIVLYALWLNVMVWL